MLSCIWLFATTVTLAYQAPLTMAFSRQEDWNGLLFFSWDLPGPGIELRFSALQVDPLLTVKIKTFYNIINIGKCVYSEFDYGRYINLEFVLEIFKAVISFLGAHYNYLLILLKIERPSPWITLTL